MQFAVKPAAAGVAEKFAQADIKGGVAEVFGKAQEVIKDPILPAAEAGVTRAKDKISGVNFDKAVADSVALSQLAMAGSIHAADAALSAAKDQLSRVHVQAGIASAMEKSKDVVAAVGPAAEKAGEWAAENPGMAACAAVGVVGLGMVVAPGLLTTPLLGALGFGPGGVLGGSLAAGAQAGIGNVAAGSTFAFLQSAGAGGAALATVNSVVQGAGLTTAGVAAVKAKL